MSNNLSRVVDTHYHLHSAGLAAAVASSISKRLSVNAGRPSAFTVDGKDLPAPSEEEILAEAERLGVDIVILSAQRANWIWGEKTPDSPRALLSIAQSTNDYLASICHRFKGRFRALADLPGPGLGKAAIDEMHRSIDKPGFYGVRLWTSYAGKYLDDPEFRPFFEEANRLHAVICTHPAAPPDEATRDYHLYSVVKFPYETTLSLARLACSGALSDYPDIRWVVSHAGGTIPFLWWRLDYGYLENYSGCRSRIQKPPTEYLKNCYYDTALCDAESLKLTCRRVGADHLLLGSDSPYRTHALAETLKTLKEMKLGDKAAALIVGGNALALTDEHH